MFEIIKWIGSSIAIPILVTLVTFFVTKRYDKNDSLPKLILSNNRYSGGNTYENDVILQNKTVISGYYLKQKQLNEDFLNLLKLNGYDVKFGTKDILSEFVKAYETKSYENTHEGSKLQLTSKINETILKFKENPAFIGKIKSYSTLQSNSRWSLIIRNVGETDAIDVKLQYFNESNSRGFFVTKTIKSNDYQEVILYYFDNTTIIDKYYTVMFAGNKKNVFYLIKKKKYNKKDERLLKITYKDYFNKTHEYYCCAKVENQKTTGFGVDD
jgi:hypothetical protein